jgi:threonine 3-dehydrogenase
VLNAVNRFKVQPGDTVVVLGAGPIGLLFTSVLKANGASKVIVAEISDYRKAAAKDCGATLVVDPTKEDVAAVVKRETDGGPDVVVEAVGPLLPQAIELVRTRGTVLQFGHDEIVNPAIPVGVMLKKEVQILGAFIGRYSFDRAAKVMESGQLPLDRIVSHRFPLSQVHEGLELLRQGKGIKIILEPED